MNKIGLSGGIAAMLVLVSQMALAGPDDAPTPRKMPRTPVARETLASTKAAAPPRNVDGAATVLDTEKMRVGDIEVRLFGIVMPQLSASYGPQARMALDKLTSSGNVSCVIRDRDRDGRLLATCRNANHQDLAEEMLKRGLAMTARGSLRTTELAEPYLAAEQGAEGQKLGLWSVSVPAAATAAPKSVAAEQVTKDSDQAVKDGMLANLIASATNAVRPAPAEETKAVPVTATPVVVQAPAPAQAKLEAKPVMAKTDKPAEPTVIAAATPAPAKAEVVPTVVANDNQDDAAAKLIASPSFIERYQLLISGMLMLFTALGIMGALLAHRWLDRRDELRSIAAALRGELQAARAVCLGRLQSMAQESDERHAAWPRIRAMVFQAYVGRIGSLGAELARQIASIYGQASDYSTYYSSANSHEVRSEPVSKQRALQTLVQHIEDVVPRLAQIEQHGNFLAIGIGGGKRVTPTGIPGPKPGLSLPSFQRLGFSRPEKQQALTHETPHPEADDVTTMKEQAEPKPEEHKDAEKLMAATLAAVTAEAVAIAAEPEEPSVTVAEEPKAPTQTKPLWGALRKFATERLERTVKEPSMEDLIPDYASMTDDELEALAYGIDQDEEKKRGVG